MGAARTRRRPEPTKWRWLLRRVLELAHHDGVEDVDVEFIEFRGPALGLDLAVDVQGVVGAVGVVFATLERLGVSMQVEARDGEVEGPCVPRRPTADKWSRW